jgi:hypothetical protein
MVGFEMYLVERRLTELVFVMFFCTPGVFFAVGRYGIMPVNWMGVSEEFTLLPALCFVVCVEAAVPKDLYNSSKVSAFMNAMSGQNITFDSFSAFESNHSQFKEDLDTF